MARIRQHRGTTAAATPFNSVVVWFEYPLVTEGVILSFVKDLA
jgi:hypothetical protein